MIDSDAQSDEFFAQLRLAHMVMPSRSVYTPTDFLQWREASSLVLTPKFQRRGVWKSPARSFFIDTLLREFPVPPIYMRVGQSSDKSRVVREVVDGQQRISAVLDYMDGKYRLAKSLKAQWSGKQFSQLTEEQRDRIRRFNFSCEMFQGISDGQVLDLFSRLNMYSVPLNKQELRNGKYFGIFKQCVYGLAHQRLEFWRRHSVFTERSIARMLEVELVSEIVIAQLDGLQDKKNSIDGFYEKYEESFPQHAQIEKRFNDVMDVVDDAFRLEPLGETEFHRPPLLYSLITAIYHRIYGLHGQTLATPKKGLTQDEITSVGDAVRKLSSIIEDAKETKGVASTHADFVAACLRQTDNLKPRAERFRFIYKACFR